MTMRISKFTAALPVTCALALFAAAPLAGQTADPAPAQAPSVQAPSDEASQAKPDAVAPIRGELIEVDAEAKKLSVKTASGTEVEFIYNDATQVSGAKEGVAGLAAMKNVQIAVHFSEDAKTTVRTATRIEVQPTPAAAPQQPSEAQPKPVDPPRY